MVSALVWQQQFLLEISHQFFGFIIQRVFHHVIGHWLPFLEPTLEIRQPGTL
jgi:hypothetical protein